MELVHRVLACAAVVAVGIAVVWWVLRALRPKMNGRFLDRFGVGVVVLFLAAALVGATQLASGARPSEDLHLLYAAIGIGLVPLARSFLAESSRRAAWLMVAAYLVLGGILLRLFSTG